MGTNEETSASQYVSGPYAENLVQYEDDREALREEIERSAQKTAILVADLTDSTRYKQRHGLFEGFFKTFSHNSHVIRLAEKHNGRRIKEIGDEVMCRFPAKPVSDSVHNAILTAVEVLSHFQKRNASLKSREEKVLSKMAIHFITQGVPYPPKTDSLDLIGPCVDLVARIAGEVRPEQVLISEAAYSRLSPNARKTLSDQGVSFSKPAALSHLKGIEDAPVKVRELIWDDTERGIGRPPEIQVLAKIAVEAGRSHDIFQKLQEVLPPSVIVGGGLVFGEREIFLRMETQSLAEYRELIVETVQTLKGVKMTYSHFIFPDYLFVGHRKREHLPVIALICIHATSQIKGSYAVFEFLKRLDRDSSLAASAGLGFSSFEILEAGVMFGEHEVYALVRTSSLQTLTKLTFGAIQSDDAVSATSPGIVLWSSQSGGKKKSFLWRPPQIS